jgi:hypothetical protein
MGSDEGAASVTKKAARAGAAFDVKVAGALQAAPGPESEDAMKYRHLGDVSTPSSVLSSTPFSNNPIFRAIRLLEAFGFRVLPPKPTKTGKRGRPKTFMMPEMKVALLGAAEAELAGVEGHAPAIRRPTCAPPAEEGLLHKMEVLESTSRTEQGAALGLVRGRPKLDRACGTNNRGK